MAISKEKRKTYNLEEKMKKVLLIGADGMLGGELKERLEKKY